MEVRDAADALVDAGGAKQRAVLAQLCRTPNRPVSVDSLAEGVWGETVPPRYRQNLQVYVSTLRRTLEPDRAQSAPSRMVGHGDAYELVAGPDDIDVDVFERGCVDGLAALAAGRPGAAAEILRSALQIWRGPALVDLAAQPFAAPWIAELDARRLVALEARLEADLAGGRHAETVTELAGLSEAHPDRERLWELLVLALYRCGRQSEAMDVYRKARRRLADEVGLEPGPSLARLGRQVLEHDPALLVEPPRSRAEPIPVPLTGLLGREALLEELLTAAADRARLVVLTGPGGVGKTRLALAAAHELVEEGREVAWVPVADEHDPASIVPAIARALGSEAGEALDEALSARDLLLVVDNLEQLHGAGRVLSQLLERSPTLQVIATSRAPLRVPGERVLAVEPLPTAIATALFAERAAAALPGFDLAAQAEDVAALCAELDCLPLALELAAARIATFAPRELSPRIAGLATEGAGAERHGSLRSLVDWSVALLDPSARELLARLSACDGAYGLDVVASVAAPLGLDEDGAAVAIESIVRAGLISPIETDAGRRFTMLQTVRAVSRTADDALDAVARLLVAEAADADPAGEVDHRRLAAYDVDAPLRRQLVAWLADADRREEAAEIVLADRRAALLAGRSHETFADAQTLLAAGVREPQRSRLRIVAGGASYMLGQPDAASLLDTVDLLPDDDTTYRVLGLTWRSALHAEQSEHDAARERAEAAIAVAERAHSSALAWIAHSAAAWVAVYRGDADAAAAHGRRQLELAAGHQEVASALVDLVRAELLRSDVTTATGYAREAVLSARRLGRSRTLREALRALATCTLLGGDPTDAIALYAEALTATADEGEPLALVELAASLAVALVACDRRDDGAALLRRAAGLVDRWFPGGDPIAPELANLAASLGLRTERPAPPAVGSLPELVALATRHADEVRDAKASRTSITPGR